MRTQFKTKSRPGDWVLGSVLIGLGLLCLLAPAVALALSWKATFRNGAATEEIVKIALAFVAFGGFGLVLLGLGLACLHLTVLPRTLRIKRDSLQLYRGKKLLGQIPWANLKSVKLKTRAMEGETSSSAFLGGFLTAGLIGGLISSRRFDPDEPVALALKVHDAEDADTFWPRKLFGNKAKVFELRMFWDASFGSLAKQIKDQHQQSLNEAPREAEE